jgi:hypothetical protein
MIYAREIHPRLAALDWAVQHILYSLQAVGFGGLRPDIGPGGIAPAVSPRWSWYQRYHPGGLLPGERSSGGLGTSDIVPDIWARMIRGPIVSEPVISHSPRGSQTRWRKVNVGRTNVVPERARRFECQQSARGSVRHPLRSGRVIETGVNKPSYMADI